MSVPDRTALLDHDHEQISVRRQCRLLGIARSGVYRERRPANCGFRRKSATDSDLKSATDSDAKSATRSGGSRPPIPI